MTLQQLAKAIGASLHSPTPSGAEQVVHRCATLEEAGPEDVTFLANPRYSRQARLTKAAAVIVGQGIECDGQRLLVAEDPYFAFRNAVVALHGNRIHPEPEGPSPISSLAVVHPTARIGSGTRVHPFAVVCDHAQVGADGVIYPQVYIGARVRVGKGCVLHPGVVVYDGCVLGDRVILHAGCVIGQDGFGYATHRGAHHKIPQTGNVVIGDDVEMGAGCAVDRATLGSTVIGSGTKFSNLVAIGHGTQIGKHNLLVALVGVAGSVTTGDYVVMGGQVGVAGHLKIGHQVKIAATAGVHTDIPDGATYGGTPAVDFRVAKRVFRLMPKLPELAGKIKELEKQVAQLQKGTKPKTKPRKTRP